MGIYNIYREMATMCNLVYQFKYRENIAGGKFIELHLTFVLSQAIANMSEKELGKKWDRCLADGAVKIGKLSRFYSHVLRYCY